MLCERGLAVSYCGDMRDDMLTTELDRLEAGVAHLEDSIVSIYNDILSLRADISALEPRCENTWGVVGMSWGRF